MSLLSSSDNSTSVGSFKAQRMSQNSLFISGIELANLVVSSGLLGLSWDVNRVAYEEPASDPLPVRTKIVNRSNCTVVAFVTSPHLLQGGRDMVSSETLKHEDFHHFDFLCSKGNPSFSIHGAALDLFKRSLNQLRGLKAQLLDQNTGELLRDRTPLIITGHSLGGSIASLFTLWLLDSISLKSSKLPLCITFGSPLVGDQGFQQAVSDYSRWQSCFLHVASNLDPVPRLFNQPDDLQSMSRAQISPYTPFGTFLLCSKFGCACIEDPKAVSRLLEWSRNLFSNVGMQNVDYGSLLEHMKSLVNYKGISQLGMLATGSLQAGLVILLEAIGIPTTQDQQQQQINFILKDLEDYEISKAEKKAALDPSRKLNDVKKKMANLEWYKKKCKDQGIGYYDSYKNRSYERDHHVTTFRKFLVDYWETTALDSAKKPQKEGAHVRTAWLFGGTNYRRMVEPLVIAEYYREGDKRDYENQGRSEHFKLLEKWQKEDPGKNEGALTAKRKKNVAGILTLDSLFWARVEEALIRTESLKNAAEREEARQYLQNFEMYVMNEINNYALSPEVFLPRSSFMRWWEEFHGNAEALSYNYNPGLLDFMQNAKYEQYKVGEFY